VFKEENRMMQTASNEEEETVADAVPPVDTAMSGDRVADAEKIVSEDVVEPPAAAEDEPRPKKKKRLKLPAVRIYVEKK
jgi:hypothetical protein